MKITLDFGNGIKRRYNLIGDLEACIRRGYHVTIEFCHPNFGEVLIAKPYYGGLQGLTNYCCDILKGKLKAKKIKLPHNLEESFRKRLAHEIAKQIIHTPKRRG